MCEQPPGFQTMMTAVFSPSLFTGLAARRRNMPGRLNDAKPARPIFMKPRRLPGPGQIDDALNG